MADKDAMLARIETAWASWLDAIDGLDDEQVVMPNAAGEWSVKDLMNHVAFWDNQAREESVRRANGTPPRQHDWQTMNDQDAEANLDRPVAESRQRMMAAHSALIETLVGMSVFEESWVDDDTWNHYPEHAEDIRNWRQIQGY